jgi:hypothetical protein
MLERCAALDVHKKFVTMCARIVTPDGELQEFFAELVDLGGVAQADPAVLGKLCESYALEMDPASVPGLVERFGLRFPAEPLAA